MKKVSLGIIGLGYVGQIHLRNALKLDMVKSIAVSDVSKKALNKARSIGVAKTYSDYNQLLKDPEVDAVVIALPTHLHLQCSLSAAESGKHIFLEKPMARNPAEAQQILSSARRNSVSLMIGYPLRFNRLFASLKQEIDKGALGDVEVAQATYISSGPFMHRAEGYAPLPVPEWWFNRELTGGGVLIDLGSHVINLLRWYFGEIRQVTSHLRHRFNLDLEDGAICVAKFESGPTAIINVGWFSQAYRLQVELFGSVSHVTAQHTPSDAFSIITQTLVTGTAEFFRPHLAELQYFVASIAKDLTPSPSGEDGVKDLEAIYAAYKNCRDFD
jgi:predicted dehydrogenase